MADSSDKNTVAPSRFSVLVPEPMTRFNMGKPEAGKNAFGYPGVSVQAEDHFFADIKQTVHVQAGTRLHLQAGDHFEQFAYKNLNLAANFNATLAANGKVVVAAGAGQGSLSTIPNGQTPPPWLDYNNLKLHYLVDTVSTGLKKLFYGDKWQEQQEKATDTQADWFKTKAPPMRDGMLFEFDTLLTDFGYQRTSNAMLFSTLLGPMKWTPDFVSAQGKAMPWNWASSEYKFLTAGDPYAPSAVMGVPPLRTFTKVMAYVLQTGVLVRRFSDTLESLIPSIMEFEVIARIRGLVFAVRSFNEAILKVQPDAWKQYNPKNDDNAWTQVHKQSFEPFEKGTWHKTRAELTSAAGPFDLSNCASFELEILDTEGGKPKVVDLSTLGTAAKVTVTLKSTFTAIGVAAMGDGTLKLDGTTATYSAAEQKWGHGEDEEGLPEGFTFDAQTHLLTKNGELFTASEPSSLMAFEDRTFSEGSMTIAVDGGVHAVPGLSGINGLTAASRAAALAAKLNGLGGVTATASDATVVVTSSTLGATSSLALSTSVAAHGELGLEGEASGGGALLDAEALKKLLEGKGDYTVTLGGAPPHQWIEIKHHKNGKDSYLEFAGDPAKAIFGKTPASAKGTDPGQSPKDLQPLLNALFETLEGTSVQALFRPVLDAVQQVVEVWGKLEDTMKGLQAFLAPQKAKPHLALTAGPGGVTIATNGAVSEVGHSVTVIAAGSMTEVNEKKFIPLVEDIIHGVEKANEMLAHYLWQNPYEAALVPPGAGTLNLISSGTVNVVAKDAVRVLSSADFGVIADNVTLQAAGAIELCAHAGTFLATGAAIQLGSVEAGKGNGAKVKEATKGIDVSATEKVGVHTEKVGLWLAEKGLRVALGSRNAGKLLDETKVHLAVTPEKATLGDANDHLVLGDGQVSLKAKTKLTLNVNNKCDLEATGGSVKINGTLDVCGVLKVSGVPVPAMPEITLAIDAAAAAAVAVMQAKLSALTLSVTTLQQAITTANAAIEKVRTEFVPLLVAAGQASALQATEEVRDALIEQQRRLEAKLTRVEAELRGAGRADLIKQALSRL